MRRFYKNTVLFASMKKQLLILIMGLLVGSIPVSALVNGRPLNKTLQEMNAELQQAYRQREQLQQRLNADYKHQHQQMVDVIQSTNETSLLLYMQEEGMTFDMSYALKKAGDGHRDFNKGVRPHESILSNLDYEIDRYDRLMTSLNHMSALGVLDSEGESYRDSCLYFASQLQQIYIAQQAIVQADSTYYQAAKSREQATYEYAQQRYQELEQYIFVDGQTPFMDILAHFSYYWNKTQADLNRQYDLVAFQEETSGGEDASFDNLSSKSENVFLIFVCVIQLLALMLVWLVIWAIVWGLNHIAKLRRFIPQSSLFLFSVLVGTVLYFLTFGYVIHGDEYVALGVSHINTFLWLLIAISGSLLLRVKSAQIHHGLLLYSSTFLIALVIIICRNAFVPDSVMTFLFPPVLLIAVVRQLFFCLRETGKAPSIDTTFGWLSLALYLVAFVFSFFGFTFVALLFLMWWYFQLAMLLSIVCILDLLDRYKKRWLDKRIDTMRSRIAKMTGEENDVLLLRVTWLYAFVRKVAVPVLVLISIPFSVKMSLDIFDFNGLFMKYFNAPFVSIMDKMGFESLSISPKNLLYLAILFYILRYFNHAIHAIWQYSRYRSFMRKYNRDHVRPNEINLSLGNSILTVLIWMGYSIACVMVLKIPTGSLALIAGGLSAGIGLAMKDIINNFIYGIQLMGGRLRVGDWIECEGVRGRVVSVNYQCVQIETIDGTEVSFLNATLFGKSFNNLTRNNSYELTKITVGVAYGTDINRVREVLVNAMQKMRTKDRYGREIVDPRKGVYIIVDEMSDSAVVVGVKQYVLEPERIEYVEKAKEVIYNALTEAGITIAFPQCDVHLYQE